MTIGERRPARSRLRSRGADVVLVTVRELRLLLGLLLVLFVTSETWRYIGRLALWRLVVLLTITVGGALLVAAIGLPRALPGWVDRRLRRRATARVSSEAIGFGAALCVGLVLLGATTMDRQLVSEWTGVPAAAVTSLGAGGPEVVVPRSLIQVAAFLAALGALAFAAEAVVDPATRDTLLRDLVDAGPAAPPPTGADGGSPPGVPDPRGVPLRDRADPPTDREAT
ncbi:MULTISPECIES: hypothetical protein [unclassified Blastococcus]